MTGPAAATLPADPFPRRLWPRVAAIALVVYVIYACAQLEVSWERLETGWIELEGAGVSWYRGPSSYLGAVNRFD